MAKRSRIAVTPGSGNVFADLGFAEPGEELAKAQLASLIGQVIKKRHLTQAAAARPTSVSGDHRSLPPDGNAAAQARCTDVSVRPDESQRRA
jgi:hypothetical protein